jgi:hypothetical protein
MIDKKVIVKTNNSYIKAIKSAIDDFGVLDGRLGSGYTHHYGDGFEAHSTNYKLATEINVSTDTLFEFGRPMIIQKDFWTYTSSYFRISFAKRYKYTTYYNDYGKMKKSDNSVFIKFASKSYGIGNWKQGKAELNKIAKTLPKDLKKELLDAILEADKELEMWKKALRGLSRSICSLSEVGGVQ